MKKIKVLVDVSEKAAILAGQSEHGQALVTINPAELTPEQREELARCPKNEQINNEGDYYRNITDGIGMPQIAEATPEMVLLLLEARRALRVEQNQRDIEEKARQNAAHEKKVKEWLAKDAEAFLEAPYHIHDWWTIRRPGTYNAPPADERLDELNTSAVQMMTERNSELELKREAERKADDQAQLNRKAAEKARTEAQDEQIRKWVDKYGTSNQKERQAANVLPREEIVDCIRSQVFSALDEFDRFERLQPDDVCENEYGYEAADVEWETSDSETVTSEQWMALQAIRAELEDRDGATVTLRRHYGECDCGCDGEATRFSIRVEIKVDAFMFSREYAAPGTDDKE